MLCDRDSNLAVVEMEPYTDCVYQANKRMETLLLKLWKTQKLEVSVVLHRKRQQFQGYYRKAIINYIGRPDDINRCIG